VESDAEDGREDDAVVSPYPVPVKDEDVVAGLEESKAG